MCSIQENIRLRLPPSNSPPTMGSATPLPNPNQLHNNTTQPPPTAYPTPFPHAQNDFLNPTPPVQHQQPIIIIPTSLPPIPRLRHRADTTTNPPVSAPTTIKTALSEPNPPTTTNKDIDIQMLEFNKLLDKMYAQGGREEAGEQLEGRLGDDGFAGFEDYSSFLNLPNDPPSATQSHFPNPPISDPEIPLPSSTTESLLASFDQSLDPTFTQRSEALLSDFSPEIAGLDMFASQPTFFQQQQYTGPAPAFAAQGMMWGGGYGCEPAFDDVDLGGMAERGGGIFGLSLFGGIPGQGSPNNNNTQQQQQGSGSDAKMRQGSGTELTMEEIRMLMAVGGGEAGTASPRDMFAAPVVEQPVPTQSVQASPMTAEAIVAPAPAMSRAPSSSSATATASTSTSGKAPTAAQAKKGKKAKPYEPNGVRNKVLLGADAPTQTKQYLAPGSTTRKLLPVGFQKKLKLSAGAEVTADDLGQEVLDEIEEKRRKNCVAARESRKRKQDYLNGLRGKIEEWEEWAKGVEKVLRERGIDVEGLELPGKPEEMEPEE